MNVIFCRLIILSFFLVGTAFSATQKDSKAKPTLADHIHSKHTIDIDRGWLPDLTGLPNVREVAALVEHVNHVMRQEKDPRCKAIDWRLRHMVFLHFAIYQHMANRQSTYLDEEVVHQWAKVLAMVIKESSGDTTNITSMTGATTTTYLAETNLARWRKIHRLTREGRIPLNYQTNFGLTQLSADRLFNAFKLARDHQYMVGHLEGLDADRKKDKLLLDTAVAIRRLIWFYQDFAQGRLSQRHPRIYEADAKNPEHAERAALGLELALLYCGTDFMFSEGYHKNEEGLMELKDAMASIAYCKLGNARAGYGHKEMDAKCFAAWVTLCPALNFDIALLTPMNYFATRDTPPVCQGTFRRLLNTKPLTAEQKKKPVPPKEKASKKQYYKTPGFGSRLIKLLESLERAGK